MSEAPYYDRDGITIYHADCRDVLLDIDPASVDLLLTDPPYGQDTAYKSAGGPYRRPDYTIAGDDEPFDPAHLLSYGTCILFGANFYADKLPPSGAWVVWDRMDGLWTDKREQGFNNTTDAELAWTSLPGVVRMYRHRWNGYNKASERGYSVHPTQKPVALMRWIVDRWTKPGDLVLDPYMGSGPVAQACHELGRRYIGIELVEDYCAIAVKRLAQQTLALEF